MDLWLLWSAAEYGLATRDMPAFGTRGCASATAGAATLWRHLKRAFAHQESLRGPHGGYLTPGAGDWSDFSTAFLQMTESNLVSAQLAYVYPRLAELADLRGDRRLRRGRFAPPGRGTSRSRAASGPAAGWYSRGYAGERQIGRGVIFGEPQPWAILAGAPHRRARPGRSCATSAATSRGGRSRGGSGAGADRLLAVARLERPRRDRAQLTGRAPPPVTTTPCSWAASWYAVNGWLAWSLGHLGATVPGARRYAFDELQRNTLRAHARAYPRHWGGTISVDDVCHAHFSTDPAAAASGSPRGYTGQVMHQPAWLLYDTIRLAGIEPTTHGYRIEPQLPLQHVLAAAAPRPAWPTGRRRAQGYVVTSPLGAPEDGGEGAPAGRGLRRPTPTAGVYARGGAAARSSSRCGRAGHAAQWAITRGR